METSLFFSLPKHSLSENQSSQPDLVKQKPCLAQESPGSFLLVWPSQPHDSCSEARGSPAYSAVLLLHSQMAGWGEPVVLSLSPAFPAPRTLPLCLAPVQFLSWTAWPPEQAPECTARNTAASSLTALGVEVMFMASYDAWWPWITCPLWWLVQLLSCIQLFATPWTAARQASLSITNSWSLPRLRSIESVMPSNHLILCRPLLLLSSIFPSIRVFSNDSCTFCWHPHSLIPRAHL